MDLERYSAKMILVPWDMMCDRKDRRTERTGEQKGQENRKDRRTERTRGQKGQENRKDRRKEIQEERNTGGKKYRK